MVPRAAAGERQGDQHRGGDRRHDRARRRGLHPPGAPAHRLRRIERLGESVVPERRCPLQHAGPVGDRLRGVAADQPEHLLAQAGRGGDDRKRGQRGQPEQHRGGQFAAPALVTDRALLDMPVEPLAHQDGQLPVPVRQHGHQRGTILPAGPGDKERAERGLQLIAGAGEQRVRVIAGDPEHVRDLAGLESLPELQLDQVLLAGVQPAHRGAQQRAQFLALRAGTDLGGLVSHLRHLVGCRYDLGGAFAHAAAALVTGHGIKPRPEPVTITQSRQPACRDDKCVLHGVGGIRRLAQQGPAVGVQRRRVLVVCLGKSFGVARHNGRD